MVRLAATVMLVRPADEGRFEVLMLRRSEHSHFVPDAFVFPGGTVDAADMEESALRRARGTDAQTLDSQFRAKLAPEFPAPLGSPSAREAAGLLIAAVRELFEEAGVLLACDAAGNVLYDNELLRRDPELQKQRRAVHAGELSFSALLENLDIYADARRLALFSQWITPPTLPQRYNAHFFVAPAHRGQQAAADSGETHDSMWIEPQLALQQHELGKLRLVYPTIKHLERLAQFQRAEDVLAFARTKTIYTIMPDTPEDRTFSLPSDLEFAW